MVESKLLYSLASSCLNIADKRRINGTQNRFLRSILGLKPAYISRIPNVEVLRRAAHPPASDLLLLKQFALYGKAVRASESHPLRQASFIPGSTRPVTDRYARRVGRPRTEWIQQVQNELRIHFSDIVSADALCLDAARWKFHTAKGL